MSQQPPPAIPGAPHQVVLSPEQHRLELPIAGPSSRMLAYAIDFVAIFLLEVGLLVLVTASFPLLSRFGRLLQDWSKSVQSGQDPFSAGDHALLIVIGFLVITQIVIEWGYFILLEATMGGRSLGKAVVKLRVVGDGGHPLRFGESVVRNLLRGVDILPSSYVVGLVSMIASAEGKRLGDYAAGTVVIRLDRPPPARPVDTTPSERAEAFRFDRAQLARVGPDELRLVRQTLRRLPDLAEDRVPVVLERAADSVARRIGHDPVAPEQREDFLRALLHAAEMRS